MPIHPDAPRVRHASPWGMIQTLHPMGPDAVTVSTASHGGIWVSPSALARIPAAYRSTSYSPGPWFEEDSDWAIPFLALRLDTYDEDAEHARASRTAAEDTLRNWNPDAFEAITGEKIPAGMSRARDEAAFYAANAGRLIVTGAYGSWAAWVPDGFVGVCARSGGHRAPSGVSPAPAESWFLIDKDEYQGRGPFGFVIDPARHQVVTAPANPGASK